MTEIYRPTPDEKSKLRMKPDQFKVSGDQAFFTLQGEGQSIGKPAVFLRLHFCNLRCGWCDTKYTWDKNTKEFWQEGDNWDFQHTVEEISKYPSKRLVITGGEPMLQQVQIAKFAEFIPGWEIEIETNGTVEPLPSLAERCQFNVSPKLENSGNSLQLRYKPDVLKALNTLPKTTFKFVVQNEEDLKEVNQIVKDCNLHPIKVIIMPEGVTQERMRIHAIAVAEQVKQLGWRLVPRLQVMLWGAKRKF